MSTCRCERGPLLSAALSAVYDQDHRVPVDYIERVQLCCGVYAPRLSFDE
jgi:hypothetical protein